MNTSRTTAKDFFLWAGVVVSFYWSVIAFILLIINYIDYSFPNALSYYSSNPYQGGISYEMASIIVLFPIYILLMWFIRKDIANDPGKSEIWARRWAIILTLFVAGITMALDLITLLRTFLNGEDITTAFLLKVLVVLLVAAGVFMHFIADLRGYWARFPERQNAVRIGVAVLAVVSIISGFFIVGTPQQARQYLLDEYKVNDLTNIYSQVVSYYQAKQKVPVELSDLAALPYNNSVPVDAQTGQSYEYQATGALSFKLCADFNAQSRVYGASRAMTAPVPVGGKGMMQDDWNHGVGHQCFERTIDPSFFPPIKMTNVL